MQYVYYDSVASKYTATETIAVYRLYNYSMYICGQN